MKKLNTLLGTFFTLLIGLGVQGQCTTGVDIYPTANPGEYQIDDLSPVDPNAYSGVSFYQNNFSNYVGQVDLQPNNTSGTFQFPNNGTYLAQYYYYNNVTTCSDSLVDTIVVTNTGTPSSCVANFNFTYNNNNSLEYFFTSSNFYPYVSSYWNFGDGNTGYGNNTTHIYASGGTYNVCHTVIDSSNNCSDTLCQTITVFGSPNNSCDASFLLFQDSLNQGQYYAWNLSTGQNLSYSWDFGDGNSSNAAYPSHVYANPGTYTICLTINDNSGNCTDMFCDTINVVVKAGTSLNILNPFNQTASVDEHLMENQVNLFPNPSNGIFNIDIHAKDYFPATIFMRDMTGKVIEKRNVEVLNGDNKFVFTKTELPGGVYVISVLNHSNGKIKNIKYIKK